MSLEQLQKENRERLGYVLAFDDKKILDQITTTSYQRGVQDAMEIIEKKLNGRYTLEDKEILEALEALTNQ